MGTGGEFAVFWNGQNGTEDSSNCICPSMKLLLKQREKHFKWFLEEKTNKAQLAFSEFPIQKVKNLKTLANIFNLQSISGLFTSASKYTFLAWIQSDAKNRSKVVYIAPLILGICIKYGILSLDFCNYEVFILFLENRGLSPKWKPFYFYWKQDEFGVDRKRTLQSISLQTQNAKLLTATSQRRATETLWKGDFKRIQI